MIMGKHSLPRSYSHFWTVLGAGVATAAIVTGTMSATSLAADAYAEPAPQLSVAAFCDAAAERDYVTGVHDHAADLRCGAQMIADRLDSGQSIFEDWTWMGMPPVVGDVNDELLDQWEAAGRPDPSGWLASYAAQPQ